MRLALFFVFPAVLLGAVSFLVLTIFFTPSPLVLSEAVAAIDPSPTEEPLITPSIDKPLELIATVSPTLSPSPSRISPTPTIVPTSTLVQKSISQRLFEEVNAYRASVGLSSLQLDSYTCAFALLRANEIATNFNHDGFTNRVQNKTLPYPSFSDVSENIAMNTDSSKVVPNWIGSSGHAENMRKDVPFGCVQQIGNFFVFETWKP